MKTGVLALLLVIPALSQTPPKKEPKQFKPPDLQVAGALVAKDEGCAKDLVKSISMEGLAQRKFLAELITYGCVTPLSIQTSLRVYDVKQFGEGPKKVRLSYAELFTTLEKGSILHGWVFTDEIFDASWQKGPKNRYFQLDLIQKVQLEDELRRREGTLK